MNFYLKMLKFTLDNLFFCYFEMTTFIILLLLNTTWAQHGHSTRKNQSLRQRMLQTAASTKGQSSPAVIEGGYMTAPQCRCKDIKDCNQELMDITNKCRVNPKCDSFLKKIGNAAKIRACLTREQGDMDRLEKCVEKKVGPIGCTNDEHPKNLTIPIMSMPKSNGACNGDKRPKRSPRKQQQKSNNNTKNQQDLGHAPMEMSDYLMCVDECAMNALNDGSQMCTSRTTPLNCAVKLRCTLAPPDERGQRAFEQCEKETGLLPQKRFLTSCHCLKNAGVNIQCPK